MDFAWFFLGIAFGAVIVGSLIMMAIGGIENDVPKNKWRNPVAAVEVVYSENGSVIARDTFYLRLNEVVTKNLKNSAGSSYDIVLVDKGQLTDDMEKE